MGDSTSVHSVLFLAKCHLSTSCSGSTPSLSKPAPVGDTAGCGLGCTSSHGAWARGNGGLASLAGMAGDARVAVLAVPVALVPRAGWWERQHHAAPGLPLLLSLLEH